MSTDQPAGEGFSPGSAAACLAAALQQSRTAIARYLPAADVCDQADLYVLSHALRFCAAQEKEHAAILSGLLEVRGLPLPEASPCPPLPGDPCAMMLEAARACEDRGGRLWPAHAALARQEGDQRAATALERMAATALLHARRFRQYAHLLQQDALFRSSGREGWLCLPCGHLHYGAEAPLRCSACGRSRGHFIRSDFHPFSVASR